MEKPSADATVVIEADTSVNGVQIGALLINWTDWSAKLGGWGAAILPLAAPSGMEIAGGDPLVLGYAPATSVSPDGRLLAVSTRGSGAVTIFDLSAWKPVATIYAVPALSLRGWSTDGARVFGFSNYCSRGGYCGEEWVRELWEIDVISETAHRLVAFDFSVDEVRIAAPRDGNPGRAYVLAFRNDACCDIDPAGDPFIAAIDLDTGEVLAEIVLPGMLIGQPGHWLGDERVYAYYQPGLALVPDDARLYVVDSIADEVTIVDLNKLQIERTVELREKRSALGRAGSWLWAQVVSTAEAKGGPVFNRQVEVTPDGGYLLIAGTTVEKLANENIYRTFGQRPAGLMVVDTESMSIVWREPTIGRFQVTPDGRWLLGTGSYWEDELDDEDGFGGLVAFGLKLIDLESLEVASHFWPELEVRLGAVTPDSKFAFVTTEGPGMEEWRRSGVNCEVDCLQLSVIDLQSGEIVGEILLDADQGIVSLVP